jgi:uncharacterized protein (TIGR02246 family)
MNAIVGLAFATALIAIPVAAESPVDTTAQIQKNADGWMAAYNNRDAAGVAKVYVEDAVYSNPGWSVSGRAAIIEGLKKDFALDLFKMTSIVVDKGQRFGDVAYSRGTWAATMKGPDGKEMPVHGTWLTFEKCQGQDCLIQVHNVNMEMPPPK